MQTGSVSSAQPAENYLQSLADSGRKVTKYVGDGLRDVITYATHVKDDIAAHSDLWKSVPAALKIIANDSLINGPAGCAVSVLEGSMFLGDIGDFQSGKLSGSSWVEIAKRVFFAFSNLGTTLVWIHELGIISLGTGLLSTFSGLSSGAATVGFGIGAADAMYRLANLDDYKVEVRDKIRNKAILDTIASVAGVALTAIAFAGVAFSAVTVALLVLTCSGFGILSFCYSKKYEDAFAEPEKDKLKPSFWTHCSNFVASTENFEKIAKLFNKLADGATNAGVVALAKETKSFVEIHEFITLPKTLATWFVPTEVTDDKGNVKNVYEWEKMSGWRIANNVFLTALSVITIAAFTIKYKLVEFALLTAVASASIGGVAVLALAAAVTTVGNNACGFIENSLAMYKEYSSEPAPTLNAKTDIKEWKIKNSAWKKSEKIKKINVEKKIAKWAEINANLLSTDVQKKEAAFKDIRHSYQKHAKKVPSGKSMNYGEYTQFKLNRYDVRNKNADARCNKAGISMLTSGTKASGATLLTASMYLTAAAIAAPVVSAVTVAGSGLALIGAVMGVVKVVTDESNKTVLKEPSRLC